MFVLTTIKSRSRFYLFIKSLIFYNNKNRSGIFLSNLIFSFKIKSDLDFPIKSHVFYNNKNRSRIFSQISYFSFIIKTDLNFSLKSPFFFFFFHNKTHIWIFPFNLLFFFSNKNRFGFFSTSLYVLIKKHISGFFLFSKESKFIELTS